MIKENITKLKCIIDVLEYDQEFKDKIIAKTSLRRFGKPSDVITAIDFILYNEFLNGEIINVDGGLVL